MKNLIFKLSLLLFFTLITTNAYACTIDGHAGEIIKVVVGDWGGDGHAKTEDFYICSNLPKNEINQAYQEGVKIIGFDLTEDVAVDYDDYQISREYIEMIEKSGFESIDDDFIETDFYTKMWLHFVKVGNPDFNFNMINGQTIDIGGYGLLTD